MRRFLPESRRVAPMQTPARFKRAMTFPSRMLYGGGLQDVAVPLRLAHYPPVMTCFRRLLGAPGSERSTAAVEARGMAAHAEAAPRAGAPLRPLAAAAPGHGMQNGSCRRCSPALCQGVSRLSWARQQSPPALSPPAAAARAAGCGSQWRLSRSEPQLLAPGASWLALGIDADAGARSAR